MVKLKLDENHAVNDLTLVLSSRDMTHQGQISNVSNVVLRCSLNSADEINFIVHKKCKDHIEQQWDKIDDLKLLWVKELNEYFQIHVTQVDEIDGYKSISGTSLCESELSQINIYGLEVNTESDILQEDYEVTKFYDPHNKHASLLDRVLSFAKHYSIKHVDSSLMNIQRQFSVDGTSVYDFLVGECADEFKCIFEFDSAHRQISVYDLYTVCNECGYRGEYQDVCPECGATNLKYFGEDTLVYVDKENLTDSIELSTDIDSVKNCFKLVAGDDIMTATVKNCNPNGSDRLYKISEWQERDMPKELVDKIHDYDKLYLSKVDEYQKLMDNIYECIDQQLYYNDEMMPTLKHDTVTASTEANKLTQANLSPVGINGMSSYTSTATVNSALVNYAKVFIKEKKFNIQVNQGTFTYGNKTNGYDTGTWTGNFTVTNYSDKDDVAISPQITVTVTGNYQTFLEQKIKKSISKNDTDDGSVFDVLEIDILNKFKEALKQYCLQRLISFHDAIQGVIDVMIEADQATESADFYKTLYEPYYNKLVACQNEMDARQKTIDEWAAKQEGYEKQKRQIQKELNFENYVGTDLFLKFCAYRREDTYNNSNYISDGLSNSELFSNAREFIEAAKKELDRACEPKMSISTTLHNLLILDAFKPIVDKFELGNWIRVGVDDKKYRLRLIAYEISFDDIQEISVEFADVTKVQDYISDLDSIIDSAKSMGSSYSYYAGQATKGEEARGTINDWVQYGLDSALVLIKNNENEEVTTGKYGILCRSYDDISDTYSDEQLRITHNLLVFTKDNWKSASLALGKHKYHYYDEKTNSFLVDIDYGLTATFVQAGYVLGSQIIGGDIYSDNYSNGTGKAKAGTHIDLRKGDFSFAGGNLTYTSTNNTLALNNGTITGGDIWATNKYTHLNLNDGTFSFANGNLTYENNKLILKNGDIEAGTFIGGAIRSRNKTPGSTWVQQGWTEAWDYQSYIDLETGMFTLGNGKFWFNPDESKGGPKLSLSDGAIEASTFIGGAIHSKNKTEGSNYASTEWGEKWDYQSYFDLDTGMFTLGDGKIWFNPDKNTGGPKLCVKDGTIEASTFIGGDIYSNDKDSSQQPTTHIDLKNGDFSFAHGSLTYTAGNGIFMNGKFRSENGLNWLELRQGGLYAGQREEQYGFINPSYTFSEPDNDSLSYPNFKTYDGNGKGMQINANDTLRIDAKVIGYSGSASLDAQSFEGKTQLLEQQVVARIDNNSTSNGTITWYQGTMQIGCVNGAIIYFQPVIPNTNPVPVG